MSHLVTFLFRPPATGEPLPPVPPSPALPMERGPGGEVQIMTRKCHTSVIKTKTPAPGFGAGAKGKGRRAPLFHRHHFFDAVHCPVDVFLLDRERRREPDDVVVRFLAQQALVLERLAEAAGAAGFREQLDANQK